MYMNKYNDPASRFSECGSPAGEGGESHLAAWVDLSVRIALDGPAGPFELNTHLTVAKGMFVALVGPSGAGKTTLLKLLAGLMKPDHGHVRVGSSVWCDIEANTMLPVRRRSIGFVFQDYALFPNMTVQGNVEYAIGRGADREEAERLLRLVGMEGLASAYPARLSGGQKQRLALIRALARRPDILMLDEPLSALDPAMRRQLQDELKRLHHEFGTTTFLVSHDVAEILRLADRVIRLENGRIVGDSDPVRAIAAEATGNGVHLIGHHVSGPDENGFGIVSVEGRPCRIRYHDAPTDLAAGDVVVLDVGEARIQIADRVSAPDQAGTILTFTSRGGAR